GGERTRRHQRADRLRRALRVVAAGGVGIRQVAVEAKPVVGVLEAGDDGPPPALLVGQRIGDLQRFGVVWLPGADVEDGVAVHAVGARAGGELVVGRSRLYLGTVVHRDQGQDQRVGGL